MTLKNAINKLQKATGKEVQRNQPNGSIFWVKLDNSVIEFMANGRIDETDFSKTDITCIRVKSVNDKDDSQSDYFAGIWCNNLSQAIRLAKM